MTLTILIMLISIGYAALNQNLNISGEAFLRAKDNIRISRIELSDATDEGYETYSPEYSKRTTKMYTTLPKDTSSVTYTVKVTNSTGIKYKVDSIDVTTTNPNVSCIPSIEVNSVLEDGITEFTVIESYKNEMSADTNLDVCSIKYEFSLLDATPPTLKVQLAKDNGNVKVIRIIAEDDAEGSGLSQENVYKYYLSTSNTTLTGGEWKDYTNNVEFEIEGDFEIKYLWIYPVKDKAGNINDNKENINTAYLLETYTFIDNAPTLYNVLAEEYLIGGVAKLYTGKHNDTYNELGTQNIYYFNGIDSTQAQKVLNKNNVIFGKFCWQMVRTTDTGGVKLIYNGIPKEVDGKKVCTNSGTEQQIGTSKFNTTLNSPAYVGYMYNTVYPAKRKDTLLQMKNVLSGSYSLSTSYWYADSITYDSSSEKYSLVSPYKVSSTSEYASLRGKYTFGSSNETYTSSTVNYIGGINGSYYYRIGLTGGNFIDDCDYTYTYGTSYTINEDGTYTINEPLMIKSTTYFDNYSNLKEKYVCINAVNNSCRTLWYVTTTSSNTFYYFSTEKEYKYAKGFTYSTSENKYILSDELVMAWNFGDSSQKAKINNAHYTCFNVTGECSTIYYIYYLRETAFQYVELKNGISIEEALQEMLSADNVNKENSTIKNTVDTWYANNMTNYTKYLEDTVFCNDRIISNYGGWNSNGGNIMTGELVFKQDRSASDLYCTNVTDRFSTGNEKAKLKYPVGLMTISEMNLLGHNYIRKNGQLYWLATPFRFYVYSSIVDYFGIDSLGSISHQSVNVTAAVRPAISLAPNTQYSSGTGSVTDPYIVKTS